MNQRGFFTIVGLCLLIIVAISIKGVHEFEANYSRGVESYVAEHHLQNLAESYLIEAAETFDGTEDLKIKHNLGSTENLKNITVEIYGKRGNIQIKNSDYTEFENLPQDVEGRIILSVASCDSPFVIGKIYRRSLAYIDDDTQTIHFMNDL